MSKIPTYKVERTGSAVQSATVVPQQRHDVALTLSDAPIMSFYGGKCPPLLDICSSSSLLSYALKGTTNPIMDWIGFRPTDIYKKEKIILAYQDALKTGIGQPIRSLVNHPSGCDCNACQPGPVITGDWGMCKWECQGFDQFKISSPVRSDTHEIVKYCERQPVYDINGERITDNDYWDMTQMGSVILTDLHRWFISQLRTLINYGQPDANGKLCCFLDGNVIDLAGNQICSTDGLTGATYNGKPIPGGTSFVKLMRALVQRIKQRIAWTPTLSSTVISRDDVRLIMPSSFGECLLNCYICEKICGCWNAEQLNSIEARNLRRDIENSGSGDVAFVLDFGGLTVPIQYYDYEMKNADGTGEMYLLFRNIGNTPLFDAEFLDMDKVVARRPGAYDATDGGLFLHHSTFDHTCYQRHMEAHLRICQSAAPWAQVRFTNVRCEEIIEGDLFGDCQLAPFNPACPPC